MELLLLTAAPIIVSKLTDLVKKIPRVSKATSKRRKQGLQLLVAALSAGIAILTFSLGGELNTYAIEVVVTTLFVFLSTSVPYWLAKKKK